MTWNIWSTQVRSGLTRHEGGAWGFLRCVGRHIWWLWGFCNLKISGSWERNPCSLVAAGAGRGSVVGPQSHPHRCPLGSSPISRLPFLRRPALTQGDGGVLSHQTRAPCWSTPLPVVCGGDGGGAGWIPVSLPDHSRRTTALSLQHFTVF